MTEYWDAAHESHTNLARNRLEADCTPVRIYDFIGAAVDADWTDTEIVDTLLAICSVWGVK